MTAEIAILNRSAVAMAADSAVTITVGNTEKIYNSAEKIFEFSRCCPVGLMVHNSLDFMGFPWDVLVRRYRREKDCVYSKVKDAAKEFINYLEQLPITPDQEKRHLSVLLTSLYRAVLNEFMSKITEMTSLNTKKPVNAREIFHSYINNFSDKFNDDALVDYLSDVTQEMFDDFYGDISKDVANEIFSFLPLAKDDFDALSKLAFALVRSKSDSGTSSGLVFTGYASDDFFPSIYALNIDGQYFGRIKFWETDDSEIDRDKRRAIIAPFAQREMVDRFVYGVDEYFEGYFSEYIEELADTVARRVVSFFNENRKKKLIVPENFFDDLKRESSIKSQENFLNEVKRLYLRDVYEIITAMPKAELAQMTEALVALTSMKRKVSLESETVGGPVDVAIITKSEGFIWIKRKLYFDKAINPGFISRHFAKRGLNDVNE